MVEGSKVGRLQGGMRREDQETEDDLMDKGVESRLVVGSSRFCSRR